MGRPAKGAPGIDEEDFDDPRFGRTRTAEDGTFEVIPVGKCSQFGVSLDGRPATAVALDELGNIIGPAETRLSRGLGVIPGILPLLAIGSPSNSCRSAVKSMGLAPLM